jgi:hypothetical protein
MFQRKLYTRKKRFSKETMFKKEKNVFEKQMIFKKKRAILWIKSLFVLGIGWDSLGTKPDELYLDVCTWGVPGAEPDELYPDVCT